jgi:hypothetical protein
MTVRVYWRRGGLWNQLEAEPSVFQHVEAMESTGVMLRIHHREDTEVMPMSMVAELELVEE